MLNVKKGFEEVAQLLIDSENRRVKTILPQLLALMQRKNNASGQANTFLKDDAGNVVAIYCYYHKLWEDVEVADYGSKKNTATGLNTMCKQGVSSWTKQQRQKKQEQAVLLDQLVSGEIERDDVVTLQTEIIEVSKVIKPRDDEHGFTSTEDFYCSRIDTEEDFSGTPDAE